MRKKDFGNTFNINKPQNYEQKVNKDIETYNSTDENENIQQKNMEFTQMYKSYLAELLELTVDNALARAILDIMSCQMELNNTYIISQKDLAEVFHKDERTIRNAIKVLKDRDFIRTFKYQRQNVYFINPRIFCKASAGYKQKLIEEYIKLDEFKTYYERHESINFSILKDTPERLVFKKSFAKEHHEIDRPSNLTIHRENQVKEVISNLSDEQLNVLLQLNTNKKALTDKEIQKIQADNEQRQKGIEASQELIKTLQREQELLQEKQELNNSIERYKQREENKEKPENDFDPLGLLNGMTIDEYNQKQAEEFISEMYHPEPLNYLVKGEIMLD